MKLDIKQGLKTGLEDIKDFHTIIGLLIWSIPAIIMARYWSIPAAIAYEAILAGLFIFFRSKDPDYLSCQDPGKDPIAGPSPGTSTKQPEVN